MTGSVDLLEIAVDSAVAATSSYVDGFVYGLLRVFT